MLLTLCLKTRVMALRSPRIFPVSSRTDHAELSSPGTKSTTMNRRASTPGTPIGVLIGSNYLHENGATGIQIENGSENIVVENNLSENNAQKYEFEAGAWIDDSKNVVVRNNILRSNKVGLIVTISDRVLFTIIIYILNNRGAGKPR